MLPLTNELERKIEKKLQINFGNVVKISNNDLESVLLIYLSDIRYFC